MKFPGMLHSFVKLFPGNSWLTVTKKKEGSLQEIFKKAAKARTEQAVYQRLNEDETNGILALDILSLSLSVFLV